MYYSTLTRKGQITIPSHFCAQFHLKAGDRVQFIDNGDFIALIPINKSIKSLKGLLHKPNKSLSCEQMNEVIKQQKK